MAARLPDYSEAARWGAANWFWLIDDPGAELLVEAAGQSRLSGLVAVSLAAHFKTVVCVVPDADTAQGVARLALEAREVQHNIIVVVADSQHLPVRSASVDVVYLGAPGVGGELPFRVQEGFRALRPGGCGVVSGRAGHRGLREGLRQAGFQRNVRLLANSTPDFPDALIGDSRSAPLAFERLHQRSSWRSSFRPLLARAGLRSRLYGAELLIAYR